VSCPRCEGQVELRGKSRTPYCRNCHQFITDGRLGDCRAGPGTHENQCPDLMPSASGKPWLDALGDPYRCELGRDHGGAIHLGGGARWPNKDYSPTIKINNPQVSATERGRPWSSGPSLIELDAYGDFAPERRDHDG